MSDRQYSPREVERMRAAIRARKQSERPGYTIGFSDPHSEWSMRIRQNDREALYAWERSCEEELRTYLLAGIEPEALEQLLSRTSDND